MAITWQNIKDLFYETIGDSENAQAFFDETTVVSFADESMREANSITRYADYVSSQLTLVGDPLVHLSSTWFLQPWRVEVDGQKMIPVTTEELRRSNWDWAARTGTPRFYMLDEYQTDTTNATIRLFETPSVDDLSVVVYAWGVQSIISDDSPTQNVSLPEWFAYCLLFGMLEKAYECDTEMQAFDKAAFYRSLWEDALHRLRIRSFGRLNKQWVIGKKNRGYRFNIRNRLPETITGP